MSSSTSSAPSGGTTADELSPIPKDRRSRLSGNSFSSSSFGSPSSSLSSSFSSNESPTNLTSSSSIRYSGIPFSWEQQPGIPKKLINRSQKNKLDPSLILLPLPPSAHSKHFNFESIPPIPKKPVITSNQKNKLDPFVTALMECSKGKDNDDDHKEGLIVKDYRPVLKSLSNRLGFFDQIVSCRSSCSVLESKVLIPRSTRRSVSNYNRLIRRSR